MRKTLTGMLAGIGLIAGQRNIRVRAGTDHLLGRMGSGQLSAGTRQRVRGRNRRQGHGRDHAVADFQTKAFTEFNAKGDAYDMVVGDSQWLGAASEAGHYVDLTDFFNKHKLAEVMAPATVKYYAEYPAQLRQVLVDPGRRRRRRLVLPQGLVRGPEGDGSLQGQVRLRPRRAEGLEGSCATSPSSSTGRTRSATASPSTPTTPMTRMVMGVENAMFSYGGELGDYATYKVDGIINSDKASRRSRPTRSSTASRLRAGPRPSSSRTTRRSPRTWRR